MKACVQPCVAVCVCVIYNIITARDWLIVTIYLNSARISLASADNWENFPRGFEIYGDSIYFRFQILTPILTALSQVYYQSFVSFCQSKHSRYRGLRENEIFLTNRIIFCLLSGVGIVPGRSLSNLFEDIGIDRHSVYEN